MVMQCSNGAVSQSKVHAQRSVGRSTYFIEYCVDQVRHPLPTKGYWSRQAGPAIFNKLLECEELRPLLPLVSALYGSKSRFAWRDDDGNEHEIEQTEGGEQGRPLMPALHALAQHDALVKANYERLPSDFILHSWMTSTS